MVSTQQWLVSMVYWCLQYSGACPWNNGVYSTEVCDYGIVVTTVQWCVCLQNCGGLESSDVSTEQ